MGKQYQKDLVSLIAPCYNGEKYVSKFLDAILNQTYHQFEVIFVDDGSTDKSEEIAKAYIPAFDKIGASLTIINKENGGLGSAINSGLKSVHGEFLTWLGIDDLLYPDYFESCVAFLRDNPDYAVVRPDGDYVSVDSPNKQLPTIVSRVKDKYNSNIFWNAVKEEDFHFGYSFMRTSIFEKENGDLNIYASREGQNWQLLLPVLYKHKSGYIDRPLYKVLYRPESISNRASSANKRIKQLEEYNKIIVETLKKMPNIKGEDRNVALNLVNLRYAHRIFSYSLMNNEFNTAKEYYNILKGYSALTKTEKFNYRKRFLQIEYWIDIKHKILNLFK